ncbi:MAG: hypothetical protein AAGE52_31445, partial [Myxococcota bacterium]
LTLAFGFVVSAITPRPMSIKQVGFDVVHAAITPRRTGAVAFRDAMSIKQVGFDLVHAVVHAVPMSVK